MNEEDLRTLHSKCRLDLSEHIEKCLKALADRFPGFRFQTVVEEAGWGARINRDDLVVGRGKRSDNRYSRFEMLIRPFSSTHIIELVAKGAIRNKEVISRSHYHVFRAKAVSHMARQEDLKRVLDGGIVAILRAPSGEVLANVAEALYESGIDVIEVTFTVPGVLDIISDVRSRLDDKVLLGAGTVLDTESARAAMLAGAEFIVCPTVNTDVIRMCNRYDKVVMPGAFTPTEVLTAWEAGADVVKVFPADVGGPSYLKALHGPLPQVRLMPTGGVNLNTLPEFVNAGACAVGLGSALVESRAVQSNDLDRIRELATRYVELMRAVRSEIQR
eukprot:g8262.t1